MPNTPEQIRARFPNGLRYDFQPLAELGWLVLAAVVGVVAQECLTFDGAAVTDWRAWAVLLASVSVRAAAGAVLAWLGKRTLTAGG